MGVKNYQDCGCQHKPRKEVPLLITPAANQTGAVHLFLQFLLALRYMGQFQIYSENSRGWETIIIKLSLHCRAHCVKYIYNTCSIIFQEINITE